MMTEDRQSVPNAAFTPAAGHHWLTPFYDVGLAALTRERQWRNALLAQVRPGGDDVIADIGCGTGSLLVRLGKGSAGREAYRN
ncbi:hypothetical protein KEU06_25010 [Pseudaminobacter sp. 19-2017]|uniref:Class I SAM-dependent methyltransferase n=1 Tax=Pseudaminobacter soli (ex Zhang et al. 2022) TaxID=2831468 RepID=A0A942I4G7_9HYPH|nr:hypothetical protein [Pseudaminobacter soli]MBS3651873.1 hypothetical protein [Pseudaminobacter soli]